MEIIELHSWLEDEWRANNDGEDLPMVDYARGVLAKWGHPTAQPVAEGPTVAELWELYEEMADEPGDWAWVRDYALAALAKWGHPTPQPVAVSERLPEPEDCLDEGWAWFFNKRIGWRQAVLPVSPGYTHWLPANALPIPEPAQDPTKTPVDAL